MISTTYAAPPNRPNKTSDENRSGNLDAEIVATSRKYVLDDELFLIRYTLKGADAGISDVADRRDAGEMFEVLREL